MRTPPSITRQLDEQPHPPAAPLARPLRTVVLSACFLIAAVGAFLIGASNNDPWIIPVQQAAPFMRGPCAVWSGLAFLCVFGLAASGLALATLVGRRDPSRRPMTRAAWIVSWMIMGYWLIAATGNFCVRCLR